MQTCVKRGKDVGASQRYQEFTSRKKIKSCYHREIFISLSYTIVVGWHYLSVELWSPIGPLFVPWTTGE